MLVLTVILFEATVPDMMAQEVAAPKTATPPPADDDGPAEFSANAGFQPKLSGKALVTGEMPATASKWPSEVRTPPGGMSASPPGPEPARGLPHGGGFQSAAKADKKSRQKECHFIR